MHRMPVSCLRSRDVSLPEDSGVSMAEDLYHARCSGYPVERLQIIDWIEVPFDQTVAASPDNLRSNFKQQRKCQAAEHPGPDQILTWNPIRQVFFELIFAKRREGELGCDRSGERRLSARWRAGYDDQHRASHSTGKLFRIGY